MLLLFVRLNGHMDTPAVGVGDRDCFLGYTRQAAEQVGQ